MISCSCFPSKWNILFAEKKLPFYCFQFWKVCCHVFEGMAAHKCSVPRPDEGDYWADSIEGWLRHQPPPLHVRNQGPPISNDRQGAMHLVRVIPLLWGYTTPPPLGDWLLFFSRSVFWLHIWPRKGVTEWVSGFEIEIGFF